MNMHADDKKMDQPQSPKEQQAVDKAPGEEKGQGEQVSNEDLKGKQVDRDPGDLEEQPIRQLP